ncbi:MAG: cytochrome C, partial [Melioribacteraceae bacterium]|nr:cytochrome C [Melioribacteraceae bacterium]
MKIKIYYPVLALFLFVLIAAFSFSNEGEKPSNNEVIKFSHQLHGEMMSCAECHTGVVESSSLSDR